MWSIVEEAGRRWIAGCTDQERGWVPRRGRESWLGLMWEVEVLRRAAAVFGRSHEDITLFEKGSSCRSGEDNDEYEDWHTAASKAVMRAGRHYVQFTVGRGTADGDDDEFFAFPYFGVIRPGWDVEGGTDAAEVDGHCFYYTYSGCRFPERCDWKGVEDADENDRVGLLLDLDQGSMTVYKNDVLLGVMATGLSGEYSWGVSLCVETNVVRIQAAAAPVPPTAVELARAAAAAAAVRTQFY
eukprot:COSAG06_NODE_1212_length_10244_cov_2.817447_5_plen_241_part_00